MVLGFLFVHNVVFHLLLFLVMNGKNGKGKSNKKNKTINEPENAMGHCQFDNKQ